MPLPEADWSIDRRPYMGSNNPKSIYITNKGVYGTYQNGAYLPNLNNDSLGGWSGKTRGDLERIHHKRGPLYYLGSEVDYNDWRDLSK